MNELTIILGVIGLVIILFALFVISIYNKIINKTNSVERAWSNVITQERQKNKIIPELEKIVEDYKLYEGDLMSKITKLRSSLQDLDSNSPDTGKLAKTESETTNLLKGIHVAVENYPDLKASTAFNNLMREITEQQENIGASIRIFNQNVEDFNNTIQVFPNSIINNNLNKKEKLNTFTDSEARTGFEYSPNI